MQAFFQKYALQQPRIGRFGFPLAANEDGPALGDRLRRQLGRQERLERGIQRVGGGVGRLGLVLRRLVLERLP